MLSLPEFDKDAYDTFWYWINERQRIYIKKSTDHEKPWSDDPIFQQWKFCNAFRTQDRQTEWMVANIIQPHEKESLELMLFNIYAFRAFNWHPTYDLLVNSQSGWIHSWNELRAKEVLSELVHGGNKLTSDAYMIKGKDGRLKHESIPETLTSIWNTKDFMAEWIREESIKTMKGLYELLMGQSFFGWGPFTNYQVVLDMTYTPFFKYVSDINWWCEFGPGAMRGIRCIWPEAKRSEMLEHAIWLTGEQSKYLEDHVPIMTLQDIEFSLCELSKYLRIKRGGRGKEMYAGA